MSTIVKVARYHLVDWAQYVLLPWGAMTFAFLVNLAIQALIVTAGSGTAYTGGLITIYVFLFVLGVLSVTRSLPFGFALGLSRRSYYQGTISLVVALGVVYGLMLTLLQIIERATGGWGVAMHFFQVPWLLDGSWYVTWLTSSVLLILFYVYGMWFGLVYRRWSVIGVVTFIACQVLVLLTAGLTATWTDAWPGIGAFFATLSAFGVTGVLAAIAAALALGGFSTMRRVTV